MELSKTFATIAGAMVLAGGSLALTAGPSFSDDTATITVSVQSQAAAAPCLTVDVATLDFGTGHAFSAPGDASRSIIPAPAMTAENCSTEAIDLLMRGTDFTNAGLSVTWQLTEELDVCDPGVNNMGLNVGGFELSSSVDDNVQTLPPGDLYNNGATLTLPCEGSGGAGELMTGELILTAVLAD